MFKLPQRGGVYFRRFLRDIKKISPHLKVKYVKHGFYRIYWREAYLHEVYAEMPLIGYDIVEEDIRLDESQKYFEEFEDSGEMTRKIKNFVEGYWDSLDVILTRVYMFKNDDEFYQTAKKAYQQMVVK